MIEYFRLEGTDSRRLTAINKCENSFDVELCPTTSGMDQHRLRRRAGDLSFEVTHNKRDHWIISGIIGGMVIHARLLEEFAKRGFTGYRLRPATVRFRDGYLSQDYSELIVTGWAGVAPPESGIELVEACGGCGYKKYTSLKHPEHLIDWDQWTGEDFFIVWPLPGYKMISRRVADTLAELNVHSYRLDSMIHPRENRFSFNFGYSVGPLSSSLPEDLAIRYGVPLGLQCELGAWPAMAARKIEEKEEEEADDDTFPSLCPWDRDTPGRKLAKQIPDAADRPAAIAALFELAKGDATARHDVARECLDLLQKAKVAAEEMAPHIAALVETWAGAYAELKPRQQTSETDEWLLEEDYHVPRTVAEVVLDVFGYVDGEEVGRCLREALTLTDSRPKCFAVISLLRRGETVDLTHIEEVASSLEMLLTLYKELRKLGKQSLLAEKWTEPWMLAASDLCGWASHPNELGVPPEEVEAMEAYPVKDPDSDEVDDVYLFRFREYPKPWEPGEGWMAAIAGAVKDGVSKDQPWSSFKKWDSMTPAEHFEKLYFR
jgi:hypothetical protein